MNSDHLLNDCANNGIQLVVCDGSIRYDAPPGVMTPRLRQALASYKGELQALLKAEAANWRHSEACDLINKTVSFAAVYGVTGYDPSEFTAFDRAAKIAFDARSITAVRAACVAYEKSVTARVAALSHNGCAP